MTDSLLKHLQASLNRDLLAFLPELVLCGTIVLMLLLRLFPALTDKHLGWVALVLAGYAFFISCQQWTGGDATVDPRLNGKAMNVFSGMLVFDNFTIFLRLFLLGFTFLVILLTLMTGIPDKEDSADFYCLLLGSVVGMSVMASSNHLLMVLLGVEMASLPSYAMAGFLKGRRQSSEAALKYVVYGGGGGGGDALRHQSAGRAFRHRLSARAGVHISSNGFDPLVLLGGLFILIGVCFKLAAVPFHFWCPDVFEGAAAEVGGVSVGRFQGGGPGSARPAGARPGRTGAIQPTPDIWTKAVLRILVPILAILAAADHTFGNLAAYGQTNLKRLLAYSTIAHAGFMMMALTTSPEKGRRRCCSI